MEGIVVEIGVAQAETSCGGYGGINIDASLASGGIRASAALIEAFYAFFNRKIVKIIRFTDTLRSY